MPVQKHTPTFSDLLPLATAASIPKEDYHRNRQIYVFVDRVIDSTKFRARHLPGYRAWVRKLRPIKDSLTEEKISEKTIGVKLYSVQLPTLQTHQTSSSAKYAEKGAEDAKKHIESLILHQVVRLKLFYRNKQNFAVCQVETSNKRPLYNIIGASESKKDISEEMAKLGYAELVASTGKTIASDSYNDNLVEVIKEAKKKRLGMWAIDDVLFSPLETKKNKKKKKSMKKIFSSREVGGDLNSSSNHSRRAIQRTNSGRSLQRSNSGRSIQRSNSGISKNGSNHGKRRRRKKKRDGDENEDGEKNREGGENEDGAKKREDVDEDGAKKREGGENEDGAKKGEDVDEGGENEDGAKKREDVDEDGAKKGGVEIEDCAKKRNDVDEDSTKKRVDPPGLKKDPPGANEREKEDEDGGEKRKGGNNEDGANEIEVKYEDSSEKREDEDEDVGKKSGGVNEDGAKKGVAVDEDSGGNRDDNENENANKPRRNSETLSVESGLID